MRSESGGASIHQSIFFWFSRSRESSVQEHGIEKATKGSSTVRRGAKTPDTLWEGLLASYMPNPGLTKWRAART